MLLALIPVEIWVNHIIPALAEDAPKALTLYRRACKQGRDVPQAWSILAVKIAFPLVKNWPDTGDAAFFTALARRYFTDPSPVGMTGAAFKMSAMQIQFGMLGPNAIAPETFFSNMFHEEFIDAPMRSNAGRKILLQTLANAVKERCMLPYFAEIIQNIIQTTWALCRDERGEILIGGMRDRI